MSPEYQNSRIMFKLIKKSFWPTDDEASCLGGGFRGGQKCETTEIWKSEKSLRAPKTLFSSGFMTYEGVAGLPLIKGVDWYTFCNFSINLRGVSWEGGWNFRKNRRFSAVFGRKVAENVPKTPIWGRNRILRKISGFLVQGCQVSDHVVVASWEGRRNFFSKSYF